MAVKRVYVHRSRYDELVDALTSALDTHCVGAGTDPASTMGPLNSAAQRDTVTAMLAEAADAGAEVRERGTLAPGAATSAGHFLRPALVLDPDPRLRIVTEQQFGPALPILPFDDVDSVVDRVNNDSPSPKRTPSRRTDRNGECGCTPPALSGRGTAALRPYVRATDPARFERTGSSRTPAVRHTNGTDTAL
ncbi:MULTISPECIES: aldehyde dehydrogenase family protein [unclassified Streptomyces]|uniref:aldehyde dehydrogenase family protein n=1 Tax=unclassified Streptomyces TaxID=2593676 RepID=UPI00386836BD